MVIPSFTGVLVCVQARSEAGASALFLLSLLRQQGRMARGISAEAEAVHREAVEQGKDWYIDPHTGFHVFTELSHRSGP